MFQWCNDNLNVSGTFIHDYDTKILILLLLDIRRTLICFQLKQKRFDISSYGISVSEKNNKKKNYTYYKTILLRDIKIFLSSCNINKEISRALLIILGYLDESFDVTSNRDNLFMQRKKKFIYVNSRLCLSKDTNKNTKTIEEKDVITIDSTCNICQQYLFPDLINNGLHPLETPFSTILLSDELIELEHKITTLELEDSLILSTLFPNHPVDKSWPFEEKQKLAHILQILFCNTYNKPNISPLENTKTPFLKFPAIRIIKDRPYHV